MKITDKKKIGSASRKEWEKNYREDHRFLKMLRLIAPLR